MIKAEQAACNVPYEKPKVIPLCSSDMLALKILVPLEGVHHVTPQRSKRYLLWFYKKNGMAI